MNVHSLIAPKAPKPGHGWIQMPAPPAWVTMGFQGAAYYHPNGGIGVISAVEVAKDKDGIDRGPEYHISITRRIFNGTPSGLAMRCSSEDAKHVLRDFDLEDAEEDNHVPHGMARNFWRPVADRFVGMACACKDDEPAIVEDKGDYVWRGS